MIQIPDHPMIRCMERTGYPDPNYLKSVGDDEDESEDDEIEPEDG